MLATPGCCACDEIGALLAGVFCGVLITVSKTLFSLFDVVMVMRQTYGAVGTASALLLRIGSDIALAVRFNLERASEVGIICVGVLVFFVVEQTKQGCSCLEIE